MRNCIYRFISPSGKSYIGKTINFSQRYMCHVRNARQGVKTKFYDACRKYGFDNFLIEILESDIPDQNLCDAEKHYIQLYNTFGNNSNGYNMTLGGDGAQLSGELNGMYSKTHTEEAKKLISDKNKGKNTGIDNSWCSLNRTVEELKSRAANSLSSRIANFNNLTAYEQNQVKLKRSDVIKKAWLENDMSNCLAALRYWEYKTEDEIKLINAKKANTGASNGRALEFTLSKNEESHIVSLRAGLEEFANSNNLVINVLYKYCDTNTPIPPPNKRDTRYGVEPDYTYKRDNTTGWLISKRRSNENFL